MLFVLYVATIVKSAQQISPSKVTKRKGDTVGSILFKTLINVKFVLKQIVEHNAFKAAKSGLNF